jgi:hypothetical protein
MGLLLIISILLGVFNVEVSVEIIASHPGNCLASVESQVQVRPLSARALDGWHLQPSCRVRLFWGGHLTSQEFSNEYSTDFLKRSEVTQLRAVRSVFTQAGAVSMSTFGKNSVAHGLWCAEVLEVTNMTAYISATDKVLSIISHGQQIEIDSNTLVLQSPIRSLDWQVISVGARKYKIETTK